MPGFHRGTARWALFALGLMWSLPADQNPGADLRLGGSARTFEALVPAEPLVRAPDGGRELDVLRQSLRILDAQYVDRRRLEARALLVAGMEALRQAYPDLIEVANAHERLITQKRSPAHQVRLCLAGIQMERFELCKPASKPPRNQNLAAKASLVREPSTYNLFDTSKPLLLRVGPRVFFETGVDQEAGMTSLDAVARPFIAEIARQTRREPGLVAHQFLNGLLRELDPHSAFLNASEYRELHIGTRGQFGGVGIVINTSGSLPVVDEVVLGSPAHRSGIRSGDIIVRVGKSETMFQDVNTVVDDLRSQTSTRAAQVWFYRPSTKVVFKTFLHRAEIDTRTVEQRRISKASDIVFARITNFSERTAEELWETYDRAHRTGNPRAMILDLRGNPGGLLDEAVEVADLFLRNGRIVSVKSRFDEQEERAGRSGRKIDLPLVVLVNASSASASEIVAGALRDQNRALILGEKTFGKGSVQSLFETGNGTALKLTVAHHFTPSGTSIQGTGINPHIALRLVQESPGVLWALGPSEEVRESELPHHLDNPEALPELPRALPPLVWVTHDPSIPQELALLDEADGFSNRLALAGESLNLNMDGFARSALRAARIMVDFRLSGPITPFLTSRIVEALQNGESQEIRGNAHEFFARTSASVSLVAGDLSPRTCCGKGRRSFRVLGDESLNSGLVGLRFEEHRDGPVAWIPVSAFVSEGNGGKRAFFDIPPSVSAFTSRPRHGRKRVQVSFRRSFSEEEIPVGELSFEPHALPTLAPEVLASPFQPCGNGNANESCSRVRVVLRDVPQAPLSLQLIPLASGEHRIEGLERMFQTTMNGEQVTAFTIVRQGRPREPEFGGIVGALVKGESGEIFGRWPLVIIGRDGTERAWARGTNRVTWK